MLTTYSGIQIQEGLIADQCMGNLDWLEPNDSTPFHLANQQKEKSPVVDTFAFPSQEIILRLLALFSGKPQRLPEKCLLRESTLNNQAQNQRVTDFVDSVLQESIVNETYGENNELIRETEQVAIISNSPRVEGSATIPGDLFKDDLDKREEQLAIYIHKTFGAEGLRHFLGLAIGLDEHGRDGEYYFTINEHLDRLGYQRSKKGSYDPALKWKALRIIQVLSSLHLTISSKRGNREKMSCIKLFTLERYDVERKIQSDQLIHMNFVLRANSDRYGKAFQSTDERTQQYTQLLKKIAVECHRDHPLAIYLTPQFAIRWRMNQFRPIPLRVSTIMEMCDLDYSSSNRNRMRELKTLESELRYMMGAGYLGGLASKSGVLPSAAKKPFECVLQLVSPGWLADSMKIHKQPVKSTVIVTVDGLKWVQQKTGLNQIELAKALGVTRQHINNILNGRSRISRKLSAKTTEVFGDIFEKFVN